MPDEGLSARREQVRASPTRSPHGPPHGPPHDSPHTEADLRRIDGLQFPIQWKTSIWYAFAAYAEPTPDNQYTTPPPHSTTCVCRLRGTNSQQPVHRRHTSARETRHLTEPAAVKGRTTHDLGFRRESNPLLAYCSLLNPASVSVSAGNPFICCRTRRPHGHCADGSVRRAATNERDMPLCGTASLFTSITRTQ